MMRRIGYVGEPFRDYGKVTANGTRRFVRRSIAINVQCIYFILISALCLAYGLWRLSLVLRLPEVLGIIAYRMQVHPIWWLEAALLLPLGVYYLRPGLRYLAAMQLVDVDLATNTVLYAEREWLRKRQGAHSLAAAKIVLSPMKDASSSGALRWSGYGVTMWIVDHHIVIACGRDIDALQTFATEMAQLTGLSFEETEEVFDRTQTRQLDRLSY